MFKYIFGVCVSLAILSIWLGFVGQKLKNTPTPPTFIEGHLEEFKNARMACGDGNVMEECVDNSCKEVRFDCESYERAYQRAIEATRTGVLK